MKNEGCCVEEIIFESGETSLFSKDVFGRVFSAASVVIVAVVVVVCEDDLVVVVAVTLERF